MMQHSEAMASQLRAAPAIDRAVAGLDAWLETMRGPAGYGGPVAHWWQQCLVYCGPGCDWRYEGIIAGYLSLWRRTTSSRWLAKARRAGDDLLVAQLADGHFAASAFEGNPASAGTPHEAAAAVGLLLLAQALREIGDTSWQVYADAAEQVLGEYYINTLWDSQTRSFRDHPQQASFVPNKAATACEACFLLADLRGEERWISQYALPNLDRVLAYQLRGGPLDGAIAQNSIGPRRVEIYFPIYIARCVPALLRASEITGDERYLDGALRAMSFIARQIKAEGQLPTAVYANRRISRGPIWVAALGDILRAAELLRPHGLVADFSALHERLLAGQDCTGGIQSATHFADQPLGHGSRLPDLRDLLHVVGWCDKAFRYLAGQAGPELPQASCMPFEAACQLQGRRLRLVETDDLLAAYDTRGLIRYRWHKGQPWAEIAEPEFWLR